jgi:hypothetical protein
MDLECVLKRTSENKQSLTFVPRQRATKRHERLQTYVNPLNSALEYVNPSNSALEYVNPLNSALEYVNPLNSALEDVNAVSSALEDDNG